ncbi:hypothetical protein DXC91_05025 [Bacteroides uniformis]|uniref:Uncharacterized protein n=1 Tax=Bacteroides uniformis TaxID=820 RepID=A0A3E4Q4J8_BACUN|nr:hypothetical protein DXC91_05025 [Bacteroides uniformis]
MDADRLEVADDDMNIVIRSSKTVRREVRPGCPLHCFTYSLSFSNHFHLPIFCCRATAGD